MRHWIAYAALAGGSLLTILNGYLWFKMIAEVDAKVAQKDRVGYYLGWPSDFRRVIQTHQREFPSSNRLQQYWWTLFGALALGAMWLWLSGWVVR